MSERDGDIINFCVFLFYRLAEQWRISVPKVAELLGSSGILNDYVIPCFDALHTMGEQALVEDITSFMHERGFAV